MGLWTLFSGMLHEPAWGICKEHHHPLIFLGFETLLLLIDFLDAVPNRFWPRATMPEECLLGTSWDPPGSLAWEPQPPGSLLGASLPAWQPWRAPLWVLCCRSGLANLFCARQQHLSGARTLNSYQAKGLGSACCLTNGLTRAIVAASVTGVKLHGKSRGSPLELCHWRILQLQRH